MKKFLTPIIGLSLIVAFAACNPDNDNDKDKDKDKEEPAYVSQTPQNRAIVLEEYTGINCGWCPDGHKMGDELRAKFPDKVYQINIHAGGYAANTYTTPEGTALNTAFGITGYPTGVVSRELVNVGGKMMYALSRGVWENVATQIMEHKAYANVASKSTIDKSSRKLSCSVQVYFTDSSEADPEEGNSINIAIVQDNIWGTQDGGSTLYPAMWDDATKKYKHNHMLRAFITGAAGEAIPDNAKGTLYKKTFEYTIPETISNEAVVLDDLEIIVFVTQGDALNAMKITQANQIPKVINACKSTLTFK
ncbi:MAG: Omp28-related outer membrane protein [Bacteroidales bacterium]|nr:Omp28-related outer membrane protein [Bacteroidales bacterium]